MKRHKLIEKYAIGNKVKHIRNKEIGTVMETEPERVKVRWQKRKEPEWITVDAVKLITVAWDYCYECGKPLTHNMKEGKDWIKIDNNHVCAKCGGLTTPEYTFKCGICDKKFKVRLGVGHKGNLSRFDNLGINKDDIEQWKSGMGTPICLNCLKLRKTK